MTEPSFLISAAVVIITVVILTGVVISNENIRARRKKDTMGRPGRFVLEIDTDSAAFNNPAALVPRHEQINAELARILKQLADDHWLIDRDHMVRDINGNVVGHYRYVVEE